MKKLLLALLLLAFPVQAQIVQTGIPTANNALCYNSLGQAQNCLSGVFASKPSSPSTGATYFATDIGPSGCQYLYNGTIWKPASGCCVIANDHTLHSITATGAEANVTAVTIPAGLESAGGHLHIIANGKFTGTAGTKTVKVRHSATSGDTSAGNLLMNSVCGGSNTALANDMNIVEWNTATNAQVFYLATNCYIGNASTSAIATGAIDTAAASYINFNITGTASDAVGYQGIFIEECE